MSNITPASVICLPLKGNTSTVPIDAFGVTHQLGLFAMHNDLLYSVKHSALSRAKLLIQLPRRHRGRSEPTAICL